MPQSHRDKLAAALRFLGDRWCLHPSKYVPRQPNVPVLRKPYPY